MNVIAEAIFTIWMKTGQPCRPDAIAKHLGWPESKVRRTIRIFQVPGVTSVEIEVIHHSKNYPAMTTGGFSKATAYEPTKEALRHRLLKDGR